jgi:Lon-like ATP-dependent protease
MIPAANVGDLHLSDEVVDSVTEGLFTIWAVDDVSDGIGLLTGKPAGEWSEKDGWSEGSVFAACQDRLDEMVRLMRKAVKEPGKNGGENPSSENDTENDS